MFCNHCGAPVSAEQTYCVRCGKSPLTNNLVVATRGRVVQHVHLLAVLWIVGGVLSFIPVPILLGLAGMSGGWHINGDFPPVLSFAGPAMFTGIAILLGIFAFANLITGWALLKMRPWGRVLALIMGFLALFHPPFGTALGIYTLYVLLSSDSGAEYDRMAAGTEAAYAGA